MLSCFKLLPNAEGIVTRGHQGSFSTLSQTLHVWHIYRSIGVVPEGSMYVNMPAPLVVSGCRTLGSKSIKIPSTCEPQNLLSSRRTTAFLSQEFGLSALPSRTRSSLSLGSESSWMSQRCRCWRRPESLRKEQNTPWAECHVVHLVWVPNHFG